MVRSHALRGPHDTLQEHKAPQLTQQVPIFGHAAKAWDHVVSHLAEPRQQHVPSYQRKKRIKKISRFGCVQQSYPLGGQRVHRTLRHGSEGCRYRSCTTGTTWPRLFSCCSTRSARTGEANEAIRVFGEKSPNDFEVPNPNKKFQHFIELYILNTLTN